MAPGVVAENLVFCTFVRFVASASAQNVSAHGTGMLACHWCRQLGPLTTNLNRAPMSRLSFLEASYRSCCRPALSNDSCGMVLYGGKNNHLGPNQMTSSFRPSLLSPPLSRLYYHFPPSDLIIDIWSSAEFAGDFDSEFSKKLSGLTLFLSSPSTLLSSLPWSSSSPLHSTDDFDCDYDLRHQWRCFDASRCLMAPRGAKANLALMISLPGYEQ